MGTTWRDVGREKCSKYSKYFIFKTYYVVNLKRWWKGEMFYTLYISFKSFKHITGYTWRDVGREKRGGGGGRLGPPREESVRPSHRLRLLESRFWSAEGSTKALGVSCRFLCLSYVCYMNEIYDAWYLMCKYLSWAPESRLLQPWPGRPGKSPGGGRDCPGNCEDYHFVSYSVKLPVTTIISYHYLGGGRDCL